MSDDRIHQYLTDRAGTIELRPTEPATIIRRAQRRRQVRRGIAIAGVVLAVGASATVVSQRDDATVDTASNAASVVESPFEWAAVEPRAGLMYGRSSAALDGGAIYSLSTAPGAASASTWDDPATLYRSIDGAEWEPVDLPGDLWASALAGSGTRLYAVGTSPAGGGASYRVARSEDGGTTWSDATIPSELAELQARYPDEVRTAPPTIAVHGDTTLVTASMFATIDVAGRVPGGLSSDASWTQTADGIEVGTVDCIDPREVPAPTAPEAGWSELEAVHECALDGEATLYSWAELGVPDELRDLALHGRSQGFVSHEDGDFRPVALGEELGGTPGTSLQVVATDDGFTMFAWRGVERMGSTLVLESTDGVDWTTASELPGLLQASGTPGGRPAAALAQDDGTVLIRIRQADGSWSAVDPRMAFEEPETVMGGQVAFGPLGWVAALWLDTGDDRGRTEVVHSVDGSSISLVPVGELVGEATGAMVDVAVSADAVFVRIARGADGDPGTVTPQTVLVGTPRG